MNDNQAFLQAIRANFDDDAVRLVYADWLEEQGDPRAEFIRVECALAHLSSGQSGWRPLWRRDIELILRYKETWFPMRSKYHSWDCKRGFIDEITTDADRFLGHADALFHEHPVRYLKLIAHGSDVPGLADCEPLALVQTLDISGRAFGDLNMRDLADSPYLERLRDLNLEETVLGPRGAQVLAAGQSLNNLASLNLHGSRIGPDGLRALLDSPWLPRLTHLNLSGRTSPNLGNDGVVLLASSPRAARWTDLNLSHNGIQHSGFQALTDSPYLQGLHSLTIDEDFIPRREAEILRARFGETIQLRRNQHHVP
jgi:uncharacterized protein (TIGR02996 family)